MYYNLYGSTEKDVKTWDSMEALYKVLNNLGRLEEAAGLCEDLFSAREIHYAIGIQILEIAHDLASILRRLGTEDEVDAIHRCYDEAFDAVIEQTKGRKRIFSKVWQPSKWDPKKTVILPVRIRQW